MGWWIMQVEQKIKYWKRYGITFNCEAIHSLYCQFSPVSVTIQSENKLSHLLHVIF